MLVGWVIKPSETRIRIAEDLVRLERKKLANASAELVNQVRDARAKLRELDTQLKNSGGTSARRDAERLIDEGFEHPLHEGLHMELEHLVEIFSTDDAYEGLSSLGTRKPEFKGH